ncbi:MAG: DUF2214 family protein [Pseudomonadota bacterium]
MNGEAIVAYFHYASIFALAGALMVEYVLLRQPDLRPFVALLARADLVYGLCALAVLVTGLLRLFAFGKGVDFYTGSWLFHAKLSLFVLTALVSIVPTVRFTRWRRAQLAGTLAITPGEHRAMRLILLLEMHLVFLIPLFAVFMARGYGQ